MESLLLDGQMRLFLPGVGHELASKDHIDLRELPESARQEVYDFYLLLQKHVLVEQRAAAAGEGALLNEDALAEDWNRPEEDEAWQAFQ